MKIFAVWDNKAEAFMQPFFSDTVGLALRAFQNNIENPESIMNKYPNDFCLYEIGTFDEASGIIENHEQNKNLGMAIEYHPDGGLKEVKKNG